MIHNLTTFPTIVSIPVRWGEMDAFQHVNNVIYFSYFESARIAYLEKLNYAEIAKSTNISIILASIECKFIIPLFYPDTIEVGTKISLMKQDRFIMDYAILSKAQNKIAAIGSSVVVTYNYKQKSKVDIPDVLIKNINTHEQNSNST